MNKDNHAHWDDLSHTFEIRQARIVAVFGRDGGAIVEQVRCVTCREGRAYRDDAGRTGTVPVLDYEFTFSSDEMLEPALSRAAQARIIITGHNPNGHWLEVRGNGLIGYDAEGHIEGLLDPLPTIMTEKVAMSVDDPAEQEPDAPSGKDAYALPPQFLQATKVTRAGSARRQAAMVAQAAAAAQARIKAKRSK